MPSSSPAVKPATGLPLADLERASTAARMAAVAADPTATAPGRHAVDVAGHAMTAAAAPQAARTRSPWFIPLAVLLAILVIAIGIEIGMLLA